MNMPIENYLEKVVEVEFKRSKQIVCKGTVVQVGEHDHLYVLPEGVANKEYAMGFSTNSVLFDIKIV